MLLSLRALCRLKGGRTIRNIKLVRKRILLLLKVRGKALLHPGTTMARRRMGNTTCKKKAACGNERKNRMRRSSRRL